MAKASQFFDLSLTHSGLYANNKRGAKRGRDEDDEYTLGFSEHRAKRTLSLRQSPEVRKQFMISHPPRSPSVADITPVGSDTEDAPKPVEKSFFSPWSSPPGVSVVNSMQSSPCPSQDMEDSATYSDDLDMTDMLFPGSFHSDPATSISGRIPTPIHSQFSHSRVNRQLHPSYSTEDHIMHDNCRRLPSPISEDERSPSTLLEGLSDMQMEVEKPTPKKGHTRSKHSLRNWTGFEPTPGVVKKFSMGFRADCDKCRMKVPGHFSHIITVNGYE